MFSRLKPLITENTTSFLDTNLLNYTFTTSTISTCNNKKSNKKLNNRNTSYYS